MPEEPNEGNRTLIMRLGWSFALTVRVNQLQRQRWACDSARSHEIHDLILFIFPLVRFRGVHHRRRQDTELLS